MPTFNYMTVEETRRAAAKRHKQDTDRKIKAISKEPSVKNNSKHGRTKR